MWKNIKCEGKMISYCGKVIKYKNRSKSKRYNTWVVWVGAKYCALGNFKALGLFGLELSIVP